MHVNIKACFFYSCLSLSVSVYNVILFDIHLLHIHSDWNIICCYFTSCTGISIILINIFKHLKAYINFPTLTCLSLSLIIVYDLENVMSFNHLQRRRQILGILFLYGAIMVIIVCKLQLQLPMQNLQPCLWWGVLDTTSISNSLAVLRQFSQIILNEIMLCFGNILSF